MGLRFLVTVLWSAGKIPEWVFVDRCYSPDWFPSYFVVGLDCLMFWQNASLDDEGSLVKGNKVLL